MKFIERKFDSEYLHWNYQFQNDSYFTSEEHDIMYEWCMKFIGPTIDWHVRDYGVIMLNSKDAAMFKMVWM